jgi:hypothetical protein
MISTLKNSFLSYWTIHEILVLRLNTIIRQNLSTRSSVFLGQRQVVTKVYVVYYFLLG